MRILRFSSSQMSKQVNNIYLLTQAMYMAAIQLMWICSTMAHALRVASEYSLPTWYGWTAGCWLVVCNASDGIQPHVGRPHMIQNIVP